MNTKLFRPVGLKELDLIETAEMKGFPPRLSWQPIFYPVLNFESKVQLEMISMKVIKTVYRSEVEKQKELSIKLDNSRL